MCTLGWVYLGWMAPGARSKFGAPWFEPSLLGVFWE